MRRANASVLATLCNQINDGAWEAARLMRFRMEGAVNIATRAASSVTAKGRSIANHQTLAREIDEEITALHSTIHDYQKLKKLVHNRIHQLQQAALERERVNSL